MDRIRSQSLLGALFFLALPLCASQPEAKPASADQSAVAQAESAARMRRYHYLMDLVHTGLFTSLTQGPEKVIPNLVERSVVEVTHTGISRLLNLKTSYQQELAGWFVNFFRSAYQFRTYIKENGFSTDGWLGTFFTRFFLPGFIKGMVVDLAHKSLVTSTGVDYPAWIKNNTLLLLFATEVPRLSKMVLGIGYDLLFAHNTGHNQGGETNTDVSNEQ